MPFQHLPTEIHEQILQLLPRKSVYQCMFVCKSLWQPAIETYYRKITISDDQTYFLNKKLLLEKENQDQQLSYGRWTKELIIYDKEDTWFKDKSSGEVYYGIDEEEIPRLGEEQFLTLLSFLPNLEKIDVKWCETIRHYQNILRRDARAGECLEHIKEIIPGSLDVCYNFRETITRLDLTTRYNDEYSLKGQTRGILFFLPHFKCLTHLSLNNVHSKNIIMFDLLNAFPNLITFKYESRHQVSNQQAINLLNNMTKKADTAATTPNTFICKYLKTLDLTIPSLIEPYIRFVMHHVSTTSLKTLKVLTNKNMFDNWVNDIGEDTVIAFIKRLMNVPNLTITCYRSETTPSAKINTSRFFKYLIALLGKRVMHCTLDNSRTSDDVNSYFCFKLVMNNSKYVSFVYPINCDTNSITAGLEMINDWIYCINMSSRSTVERVLEFALTNCPHLTLINIRYKNDFSNFRAKPFGKNSISNRYNAKTAATEDNLTDIKMNESTFTPNLLNLLSTYLPNIRAIRCLIDKNIYYRDWRPCSSRDNTVTYNLTRLQSLNTFYLDFFRAAAGDFDYVFIQFKYTDDTDNTSCFKIELEEKESSEEDTWNDNVAEKYGNSEEEDDDDEEYDDYYDNDEEDSEKEQRIICTPTTINFINSYKEKKLGRSFTIAFECNKAINKFVFLYDYSIIAEFRSGELVNDPSQQQFITSEDEYDCC